MSLFESDELALATEIAALAYANPFLPQRIEHEQRALGDDYIASQPYWSMQTDLDRKANIDRLAVKATRLADTIRDRLHAGARASADELRLYDDVVVYVLYERYRNAFLEVIGRINETERIGFYPHFRRDAEHYLGAVKSRAVPVDVAHLFACYFQVRRAFHHIFSNLIGRSLAAAQLRAAVWQSIFTHDIRRYRRALYSRMTDLSTLINGPTGTGKELVAQAIGLSRYIPFDERSERFAADSTTSFIGLNLTALSPTLVESELFGHRKGAFTGALADREGFLESCGANGTVFLDEVGDVDPSIQVKLLRVLQNRTFTRLGDTAPRQFRGKILAATNRDLSREMGDGRFRADFYYRLCSDTITTPPLHEQLGEADELRHLVRFICSRVAGEGEADELADLVVSAIEISPGADYRWPGNFRELEQCVRSVIVRGEYRPPRLESGNSRERLASAVVEGRLTADDLLRHYCTLVYAQHRNYAHVAEKLQIDRRTVKAKVDEKLLAGF